MMSGKHLEIGTRGTALDDRILLVWFAGVFALATCDDIGLAASGIERSKSRATNAEQEEFCHIAEIEADAPPVPAAPAETPEPEEAAAPEEDTDAPSWETPEGDATEDGADPETPDAPTSPF